MGLTYSSVVDADRDEVFSWHTRPGAIVRLTPPWQPVTVLREAGSLRDGRTTLGLPGGLRWVAPEPVRNADYTRTLAAVLRRPAVLPVPGLGPRLLLGAEGAREIAQASQYVRPERLIGAGHQFRQPELTGALRHLFGRDGA